MVGKPQIPIAQISDEGKFLRGNGLNQPMAMVFTTARRLFVGLAFDSRIFLLEASEVLFRFGINPIADHHKPPILVGLLPNGCNGNPKLWDPVPCGGQKDQDPTVLRLSHMLSQKSYSFLAIKCWAMRWRASFVLNASVLQKRFNPISIMRNSSPSPNASNASLPELWIHSAAS